MIRSAVALVLLASSAVAAQPASELDADVRALSQLREVNGSIGALSMTDSRRARLASRILETEPTSALAHEELALRSVLDFEWRQRNARRRGLWNLDRPGSAVRAALRARATALEHIDAALAVDPTRADAHRLSARLALLTADDSALAAAAARALAARPGDPEAMLVSGLAAQHAGSIEAADTLFRRAISLLPPSDQAAFGPALFVRPDDRAAWDADPVRWGDAFWSARDPWLLTSQNERRLEHAARLVAADLLYAPPDGSARGWTTDRGETFVRYGAPVNETWGMSMRQGALHRWVYPGFTLTFEDWFASGDFSFASSASGMDDATLARSLANTVAEQPSEDAQSLAVSIPTSVSSFRGANGDTDLVVAFGVPVERPNEASGLFSGLGIVSGAFVRNASGAVVDNRRRETERVPTATLVDGADGPLWPDAFALTVSPGSAELIVEVEQSESSVRAATREPLEVPRFDGSRLQLSDLALVLDAGELEAGASAPRASIQRGAFWIRPAPVATFRPDEPLRLFAEVYNLALDEEGGRYSVEAQLLPTDERGRLSRLLGLPGAPESRAVSVSFETGSAAADDAILLWLDASDQPDGAYTLQLRIVDLNSGGTAVTSRSVRLSRTI